MWWLIGTAIGFSGLILFALCKSAGDADRGIERLFQEKIKLDRKEVI